MHFSQLNFQIVYACNELHKIYISVGSSSEAKN